MPGVMTATTGIACSLVQLRSCLLAETRLTRPIVTMATMMIIAAVPKTRSLRVEILDSEESGSIGFWGVEGGRYAFLGMPFMYNAKNDRNEDQRCSCGKNQASNHSPAQRGILLTALAKTQRH